MTQEEIEELKQIVAVPTKAHRPFILDEPAAPGEGTQRKIAMQATRVFEAKEFCTPFAPVGY